MNVFKVLIKKRGILHSKTVIPISMFNNISSQNTMCHKVKMKYTVNISVYESGFVPLHEKFYNFQQSTYNLLLAGLDDKCSS